MKDNKCNIIFKCNHSHYNQCVYFIQNEKSKFKCKHLEIEGICNSTVAQVNKMTVLLKDVYKLNSEKM